VFIYTLRKYLIRYLRRVFFINFIYSKYDKRSEKRFDWPKKRKVGEN